MAKSQYTSPGTISTAIVNQFEQYIGLFDRYAIYQTGQYEYMCYIDKFLGGVESVRVYRSGSSSYWTVSDSTSDTFPTAISYPYYSYSNVGWGQVLPLTAQTNILTSVSVMGLFLFFALKTMFFGWLGGGKRA